MFRVTADTLEDYFDFDPQRKPDLLKLGALLAEAAPALQRHLHQGTAAGGAGMRMKMIGYGKFRYAIKSGKTTEWPVIGVALQKNYISVYVAVTKAGAPLVPTYKGRLGELRMSGNNFSFARFAALSAAALRSLFSEAETIFKSDPDNPVRYMEGT